MTRYGMAIDLERCVGCQACATACKIANNLPKDITYNTVYTRSSADQDDFGTAVVHGATANDNAFGEFPNCVLEFLPVQCQHCGNPPCLGALQVRRRSAMTALYMSTTRCASVAAHV